ncbi:hypothetical protein [Phenylobacterium sp.]|uniref:hypothetical protein n=1 Tax=Phenylobacterium sp. TaxID=1871053 RepID=UPI003BA93C4F
MALKSALPALCAAMMAALPAQAAAPPADFRQLTVTNTTERVAYCTLIFNGQARTELAIRPGRSWYESFDPRRDLRLVCQRGKGLSFGPLAAGKTYRLVQAGSKLDIAEGEGP